MMSTPDSFSRLEGIIRNLRKKCPWDQQQTFESLRSLTIEEVYELSQSIILKETDAMANELGDLLLHIIFYCVIAEERKVFTLQDTIEGIASKLIRRHPHVYQHPKTQDMDTTLVNWEKIKLKEGANSVLAGVPQAMPSLLKAYRMQKKVSAIGVEPLDTTKILQQIETKLKHYKKDTKRLNKEQEEEDLGDLMFLIVQFSQQRNINPEDALEKVNLKFKQRFELMEKTINKDAKTISELSMKEIDSYWQSTKLCNSN